MEKRDITVKRTLSNNWFLLRIALQEAPLYTIYELTVHARHRLIVFVEHIYMIGYIINCIQYRRPFAKVFWFVAAVFVAVTVLAQLLPNFVDSKIKPAALERIRKKLREELYRKAARMDLRCYDDPDFYNEFVWAMGEATERAEKVLRTCSLFLGEIVGILAVGGYVLTQDMFGLLLTAFSIALILGLTNLYNRLNLRFLEKLKPLERKRDYISRVFYLPDYAKELRMSRVRPKLYEEFQETSKQMYRISKRETRTLGICSFCIQYLCNTFLFDGVYIIYLLYQTIAKGIFGYGTMVILYNSCSNLKSCSQGLATVLPQFWEHARYIEKIRHFLDCPVQVASLPDAAAPERDFKELCLKDVSFSYRDGTTVLKNVNLIIRKGERIALVGYNGAGKTTLVKLLMRLYDVTQGEITWNGTDIRRLGLEEYREQFSTLFQDYQLFAATLGENIVMDTVPVSQSKAAPLLEKSGFEQKFEKLKNGYDTPVTREFEEEGVMFSGGEAQMVGICRALYQDSRIIVLDEPSSALDPLSEYNLNHTMMTLDREKTVIFISHRLSTTRLADRIYMLEDGSVVEEGTHEELMELRGRYAEMFRLQMEKYR